MSTKQTILDVEGMTCSACVRHVEAALGELDGISSVSVNLQRGNVIVEHDDAHPTVQAMIAALVEAGYESRPVTPSSARGG